MRLVAPAELYLRIGGVTEEALVLGPCWGSTRQAERISTNERAVTNTSRARAASARSSSFADTTLKAPADIDFASATRL
jgi:hypothetical protein